MGTASPSSQETAGRIAYRTAQETQCHPNASDKPIARPSTRSADRGFRNGNTEEILSQELPDNNEGIVAGNAGSVKQKTAPAPTVPARGLAYPDLVT